MTLPMLTSPISGKKRKNSKNMSVSVSHAGVHIPGAAARGGAGGGAAAPVCRGASPRRRGAACRCGSPPSRNSADSIVTAN